MIDKTIKELAEDVDKTASTDPEEDMPDEHTESDEEYWARLSEQCTCGAIGPYGAVADCCCGAE